MPSPVAVTDTPAGTRILGETRRRRELTLSSSQQLPTPLIETEAGPPGWSR